MFVRKSLGILLNLAQYSVGRSAVGQASLLRGTDSNVEYFPLVVIPGTGSDDEQSAVQEMKVLWTALNRFSYCLWDPRREGLSLMASRINILWDVAVGEVRYSDVRVQNF